MKPTLSIIFHFIVSVLMAQNTDKKKPFTLGEIVEVPSVQLGEKRTLNVYLPEGYADNDTARYPVIYLLDGSADEDFIHIVGITQYLSFSWIDILPKSIVVGIATVDRRRDFTFPTTIEKDKKDYPTAGHSDKFIAFIEQDLLPFVNKNYRTTATKTLMGQSLGGLLATEVLFKKPQLFNNYLIVSPSLWWDNQSLLAKYAELPKAHFLPKTQIYIAVGNEGKVMEDDAQKLNALLTNSQLNDVRVGFSTFPQETHATIYHRAVYAGFEFLKGK